MAVTSTTRGTRKSLGQPSVWMAVAGGVVLAVSLLAVPVETSAETAEEHPTGLDVEQHQGFATVSWNGVGGASEYHIERTLLDGDEAVGEPEVVGVWTPDRGGDGEAGPLTFADSGFVLGERYQWRVRPVFDTRVTIDAPSSAEGNYETAGAEFGPAPENTGSAGIALVDDGHDETGDFPYGGTGSPTEGCGQLIDFPTGAIALVDRGRCTFVEKVNHAQDAGAVGVIVVNNAPGAPEFMTGSDSGISIPSVMVSQADGDSIRAGLPATGQVHTPMGEFSDPVASDTQGLVDREEFLTGFERSGGAAWTDHEDEVELVEAIAAASDRVRLETIGESYEGRPLQLASVGAPAPGSPEEIADSPSTFITCTIHGTEPAGREACLILLRELAFSDEARVIDILENTTVLINPTANPDGRERNQQVGAHTSIGRTNTANQDLNRDHLLLRHPAAIALADVQRDYQPDVVIDAHEYQSASASDILWLWPRSLTVGEELWSLAQNDLTRGHLFGLAEEAGWSPLQYPVTPGDNWEALSSNASGLKNQVGQVQETRRRPGLNRPGEGPSNALVETPENQQRRVYTQLWAFHEHLDYYRENLPAFHDAIAAAEEGHAANEGPIYLDGMYDVPVSPPTNEEPTTVLDPFCGYRMSPEQYAVQDSGELMDPLDGEEWTSPTVEDRLDIHGIEVQDIGAGIAQVPLAQPLRALIPYLLDPELETENRESTPNMGMVDAERLDDRRDSVIVGSVDSGVPNRVDDVSCSVNDLIADEQDWPNKGQFVRHVNDVTQELEGRGQINARERGAITRAAAQTDVGR